MKNFTLLLGLLLMITSCKSVQKLVDKGDYDGAIQLAAKKLHGQKNKKTKHVQGLEEAFAKVTKRDMDEYGFLMSMEKVERWDEAYDLMLRIKRRQEKISPFLPLVSKDGYVAHFKFVKVNNTLADIAKKAGAFHYAKAESLLEKADRGDKMAARYAMRSLLNIERYFTDYKESYTLKEKALQLGKTRIAVEMVNESDNILPRRFEDDILGLDLYSMNSTWKEYYIRPDAEIPMDYKVILEVGNISVSPERQSEKVYIDTKEVRDGVRYVLDQRGNVAKDTLGNDITEPNFITVTAEVREMLREKRAKVYSSVLIIDMRSEEIVDRKPIQAEVVFESYASNYNGDNRALCTRSRNRLRQRPEPFPSDFDLVLQATDDIKGQLVSNLDYHLF